LGCVTKQNKEKRKKLWDPLMRLQEKSATKDKINEINQIKKVTSWNDTLEISGTKSSQKIRNPYGELSNLQGF
jgi:hypothetical protein